MKKLKEINSELSNLKIPDILKKDDMSEIRGGNIPSGACFGGCREGCKEACKPGGKEGTQQK